jgi:GTP-binding protein of the ras superfamily involved in termination of M-phase
VPTGVDGASGAANGTSGSTRAPPESGERLRGLRRRPALRRTPRRGSRTRRARGAAAVSRRARAAASHRAMAALAEKPNVMVKVGMVGDSQVGKTTMMVKYVENRLDDEYIQTLGVNFMEKSITLRNTEITFSIWDLGGHREFLSMLPLVCNDAAAVLFMFDLSRKSTLTSIKEWYRQVRGLNRSAFALLVGTKYDVFVTLPPEEQAEIDRNARKFAKAMKAPCIFTSAHESINVQKMFKVILSRVFDLKCTLEKLVEVGEPLLIF